MLNFLMLGKTGEGKSATGNTILDRSVFKTSSNSRSQTKEVNHDFAEFGLHKLHVVDTPGLMDTDVSDAMDKETAAKMMDQALAKCYGGVDAFLYVIKFGGRFTEEDRSALEALKAIFGDGFMRHVIVVMSGGDLFHGSMEYEKKAVITFEQWCGEQRGDLLQLFHDCNKRFVLFNNWEKDEQKKQMQTHKLVELSQTVISLHGRYTSQCFEDAAVQREKLILEKKAPHLRGEIQEKISLLCAIIEKLKGKPSHNEILKIRSQVNALKDEIKKIDKGEDVLQDIVKLVDRIQQNLNDVEQLHILTNELENIRRAKNIWSALGKVVAFIGRILCLFSTTLAKGATFIKGKIRDRIDSLTSQEQKTERKIDNIQTHKK